MHMAPEMVSSSGRLILAATGTTDPIPHFPQICQFKERQLEIIVSKREEEEEEEEKALSLCTFWRETTLISILTIYFKLFNLSYLN